MRQSLAPGMQLLKAVIHWLFPLPYIWISTAIYSGVLIMYLVYHTLNGHQPDNGLLLSIMIVGLLILDRYEYHSYEEDSPRQVTWMFFAYRMLLIELAATGLDLYYLSFLYAFLPFIAVMRLGWNVGATTGLGVWLMFMLKMALGYPDWTLNMVHIDAVLTFHIMLGFTMLMARVVLREKKQRAYKQKRYCVNWKYLISTCAIMLIRSRRWRPYRSGPGWHAIFTTHWGIISRP